MSVLWALGALVFAVFAVMLSLAAAATAAANRDKLLVRERAGDPAAQRLDRLLADRDELVTVLRLARGLARIASAACAGAAGALAGGAFGGVIALLLVLLVLAIADGAARLAGNAGAEVTAVQLEAVIGPVARAMAPVERGLDGLARSLLVRLGWTAPARPAIVPSDDSAPSTTAERSDAGDAIDQLVVSDVMVHRTEMQMLDAALPVPEIVRLKLESRFARLPVFRGAPDNIIGVVESARVVRALGPVMGDASKLTLADILTAPWFVPDTTPVRDQLRAFLKRRTEIALVVDEYGDVMGLVTLSDIVEDIVGDITHATILDVPGVRAQPDGSYLIEGQVAIRDLNRALDWDLPDEEATTVAGLVVYEARAIPAAGQTFTFYGFTFDVLRRERNRVTRLRVTPTQVARRRGSAS